MFGFLKKKIKSAVDSFSKKAEEEAKEEVVEQVVEKPIKKPVVKKKATKPKVEKKKVEKPLPKKEKKKEKVEEVPKVEEVKEDSVKEEVEEKPKKKKGLFAKLKEKVVTKTISSEQYDEFFWDLEVGLLENNVALEVIEKIKDDLKKDVVNVPIPRGAVEKVIVESLKKSVGEILDVPKIDLMEEVSKDKPYLMLFLGFNGVGKSLSVARVAEYFKDNGKKVVMAAGDTFRAAAVAQLTQYADEVGVPIVKHGQGSDSCAVVFDAVSSAKAKKYDVVLADTAGRVHSSDDLMQELKKIVNKNKPQLKILVIEATVGSDVVDQVQNFDKAVGVDALIITKNDVYEKGGSLLSAAYLLKKPILFLGMGQGYKDLKEYDADEIVKGLL
jgi:fused signal recognition particle receptor